MKEFGYTGNIWSAIKHRTSHCKNPDCKNEVPAKARAKSMYYSKTGDATQSAIMRRYCSVNCYEKHLEAVRAGQKERIQKFLNKKIS